MLTGFGAGLLAATVAGGWCADRFGRRHTIVLGTFTQAASMLALYFAEEPPVLALLTTLCGFAGGFYGPAASALVADLVPADKRLTAYAALRLAGNSGFAFGTAAGGFLVQYNPFWLFAGDALTTASFGLLALLALPHGGAAKSAGRRGGARPWRNCGATADSGRWRERRWRRRLSSRNLPRRMLSRWTHRGLTLALGGWKLSPEQVYGLLIGWNGLMITAMELPLTRWTGAWRQRRVMACGYVLIGIGFASNMFGEPACWLRA